MTAIAGAEALFAKYRPAQMASWKSGDANGKAAIAAAGVLGAFSSDATKYQLVHKDTRRTAGCLYGAVINGAKPSG